MPKRFTDTEKWQRPWFLKLEPKYKLLWLYLVDNCDHAGVWYVNLELAGMLTGFEYDEAEAFKALGKQVARVDGKRWFVTDFVPFQYPTNSNNKIMQSVRKILNKLPAKATETIKPYLNPSERVSKPFGNPLERVKDKDKVKDSVYTDSEPSEQRGRSLVIAPPPPALAAVVKAYPAHRADVGPDLHGIWASLAADGNAELLADSLLASVKIWKKTDQWRKEGGKYVPRLTRFLAERKFELTPEISEGDENGIYA